MKLRLAGALVAAVALIMFVFGVPLSSFVARVERERLVTALERDAFILAGHAKETLNTGSGSVLPALQPYVDQYSKGGVARVVVTNSKGLSVVSSDAATVAGTDFSNRPEVIAALAGNPAVGERDSRTLGERLVFVAVPVLQGDSVLGVVRLSSPKSQIDSEVRNRIIGILSAAGFALLAAAVIAIPLALGIARPISRLTQRTERLAEGDFAVRADESDGPPEVRELSRSFNMMAGRLGLMIDHQRQFAGAVSHQLRTPLTALRLRLEQAQDVVGNGNKNLVEALEASREEADRLQAMVEQLLALARLEGGTMPTTTVNASDVVRSRIEMWSSLAAEKSVEILVDAPDTATCIAAEGTLEQIIDNYIDNALTVAPEGSQIAIEVSPMGNRVIIDVLDHGPGLSAEQASLAFERFWRGKHTENSPGSGLGLAIVRQLAVASGATAEILPRGDGFSGARARVTLVAR